MIIMNGVHHIHHAKENTKLAKQNEKAWRVGNFES